MIHRTGGLPKPCAIELRSTLFTSSIGRLPLWGVKPMSCISAYAQTNVTPSTTARIM